MEIIKNINMIKNVLEEEKKDNQSREEEEDYGIAEGEDIEKEYEQEQIGE